MNRLYRFRLILVLLICLSLSGASIDAPKRTSSNVILIIADQMRGDALGVLQHPDVRTPHLDQMARDGVVFSNYFTNNPVCVPSRMSMFSGLYPHEHGALSNKGPVVRLASAENTLLGYFKEKDYRIGWFGKDNHTFTREVLDATLDGNSSRRREAFRAYATHTAPHWSSTSPWPKEELYAYKTTTDALDFIKENREGPFFTVLSLFDPHPPYFAPAEYVTHYPLDSIDIPERIAPELLSERLSQHSRAMLFDQLTESDLRNTMAHYYAAIEWGVDHQVGRILSMLQELDIEDNTIVVFTSEHGDFMGEYGMVRKGMFLYDALLHVPFIWQAKGQIAEGIISDALTQSVDILPTLIELTGGSPLLTSGASLATLLTGKEKDFSYNRTIFASAGYTAIPPEYFDSPETPYYSSLPESVRPFHSRILGLQTMPTSRTIMARTRDWKLILSETHPPELFYMDEGWTEGYNMAADTQYTDVFNRLTKEAEGVWHW